MVEMIAQQQEVNENEAVVIHDLTNGKRSPGIRAGDIAVTESGIYRVVADGNRLRLYLVEAQHAVAVL